MQEQCFRAFSQLSQTHILQVSYQCAPKGFYRIEKMLGMIKQLLNRH